MSAGAEPVPARGDLGDRLAELRALADGHPIWQTRLLRAFAAGHLTRSDLQLVFSQYYWFSKNFTCLLAALMANCESDLFRAQLTENLWEESGGKAIDQRHAEIFRRFLRDGLGIVIERIDYLHFTRDFVDQCRDFCQRSSPMAAAAFLSLGVEGIVPRLYLCFVEGLLAAGVPEEQLHFFRMHIACDDAHAAILEQIATSYADDPDWFDVCRKSMVLALTLREQFFEDLYGALQQARVGDILDTIQARESLAPIMSAGTSLLHSDASIRRLLYRNKNERLNIEFAVDGVPFVPEVLDPRIVRIPPGRNNENHKHAHETIFYFIAGSGRVVIDDEIIPVKAGDLVHVPRWAMHQTQNTGPAEMVVLAVADFNLTRKAFIGSYLKTARLRRTDRDGSTTREADWELPEGDDEGQSG
jgi:pyrroloquinoline quinone (PQQ) biosynthesis protein C/mannose-6-phosphate isomerase-like protein (cupin superfamily)